MNSLHSMSPNSNSWLTTIHNYFPIAHVVPHTWTSPLNLGQWCLSALPLVLNAAPRLTPRHMAFQPLHWAASLTVSLVSHVGSQILRELQYEYEGSRPGTSVWLPPQRGTRTDAYIGALEHSVYSTWAISGGTLEGTINAAKEGYQAALDRAEILRYSLSQMDSNVVRSEPVQKVLETYRHIQQLRAQVAGIDGELSSLAGHVEAVEKIYHTLLNQKDGTVVQHIPRRVNFAGDAPTTTRVRIGDTVMRAAEQNQYNQWAKDYILKLLDLDEVSEVHLRAFCDHFGRHAQALGTALPNEGQTAALPIDVDTLRDQARAIIASFTDNDDRLDAFNNLALDYFQFKELDPLKKQFSTQRARADLLSTRAQAEVELQKRLTKEGGLGGLSEDTLAALDRRSPQYVPPTPKNTLGQRAWSLGLKGLDYALLGLDFTSFLWTQREHEEHLAVLRALQQNKKVAPQKKEKQPSRWSLF